MEFLIQLGLLLMAVFIILLVLVQRGRGGGLAGALGGPGGSSAFGAKAGDTFTKITIYTVSLWIIMCLAASYWASHRGDALDAGDTALVNTETTDLNALAADVVEQAATASDAQDEVPAVGAAAEEDE